jgi:heme exporter protein A
MSAIIRILVLATDSIIKSRKMLEAENLGCVRGDRRLFNGLNFSVPAGTLVQVTGANGCGKTSLLRMICGLLEPADGKIVWQGENIRTLGEEYFTALTFLGHRNGVKDELSATENLRVSSGLNGIEISRQESVEILREMGLSGRENLPARLLSEGQRRRLALARLAVCHTVLWLLDEVLTSLDKTAVILVKSLIERHLGNGGLAIVATHQELELNTGLFQRIELAS